jgi:hypothetical protein
MTKHENWKNLAKKGYEALAKKRREDDAKLSKVAGETLKPKIKRTWWVKISTKLWRELMKDLTPIQRSIYISLKHYASNEGYCYPSNRHLAEELNINKDTVARNIQKLAKKEFIKITKTKTLKGLSNNYFLLK